jgi:predicted site-specific integrase-resolvase
MELLESFCSANGWTHEIITVFSAGLYGSRSRKNKKLLDQLREAASNV